jgi:PKD repeat protein
MHSNPFAWALRSWARLGIVFALVQSAPAAAQVGNVVRAQKISATSGGFTAELEEQDQFGRSIVNLGDLDGDGVTDLMVGAHTDDDGGIDQGSVYVLFLNANGSVKSWQKISDTAGNFPDQLQRGDQFGRAAANLGDLDGDGVVDVAVCANYDDDGGTNKGAVYVLFLNTDGTVKQFQKISSISGGLPVPLNIHDEFGRSLCALGDLDGDGLTELLVGTPEDDEGGTNTGALHVLFLNADGTVKDYRRISKFSSGLAIKPGDWFGFCSANLGDLDGDGVTDVAVGAVLDDDGGVNQGSLWILFLNADGSVKAARELDELEGGLPSLDDIDQFGTSVTSLGDLDGDGLTDIAVGAVKDDDGVEGNPDADVGAVYVLLLNADASVKTCIKLSDQPGVLPFALDQWDWFGSALARYGGSSGDGLFNAVIGCRNDDDAGGNHGAIYMVQLNDGTAPFASFQASQTIGVPPMTVSFTDTSSGEVTGWLWNLGEGPLTNQQNPSKTYFATGTYDVQLTARGPKGTDVELRRGAIQVVPGLAAFEATPRSGGCPLTVSFTDRSLGTFTSWSWDFGDGTTSNLPNPVHEYAACGSYTVSLTVSGPNGSFTCSEPGFVTAALLPPAAEFTLVPASGPAPLAVTFTDATSGQVTSWSWDFGDGTSSSAASPQHTYALEGVYTVSLTASGPGGTDVETKSACVTVTGPPPSAYFEANPTLGPEPLTVSFTNLTTGTADTFEWSFGDGATSSAREPVHTYLVPGTYDVTLTARGPGGSDVRVLDDLVTVEPGVPEAAFAGTPLRGPAPLAVSFTDLSARTITSWAWDFGDGTGAGVQHPTHLYTSPGLYTVALAAIGPAGADVETKLAYVEVQPPAPSADFRATPTRGMAPLTVVFSDDSRGNVTSWSWDFGDGGGSSSASPSYVYATPGTYDVHLAVSGPDGSDVETKTAFVVVDADTPVAGFRATPTSGLAPLAVQFTDDSRGNVTSWSWDLGDGSSSSLASPAHVYTVPGRYSVELTVSGPSGRDTLRLVDLVQVTGLPPVAEFLASPREGFAPLTVAFDDQSTGTVSTWAWSFGDGGTATVSDPVHVFVAPGSYVVGLTVSGSGAESLKRRTIVVRPAPLFSDGSFELQSAGLAPVAPWKVYNGSSIVVRAAGPVPEPGFPSQGLQWCDLGAEGSSNAQPPSNPGGLGTSPAGAAGVQFDFLFPSASPHLSFEAAFLLNGSQDSLQRNDFMSVDLSDGVIVRNVYYADSFSEFVQVSPRTGFAMTARRRVLVDLAALFPDATESTVLGLRVGVGNVGGAINPSRGYVDDFRLSPSATATFRNGHGLNPAFYVSSPAVLGGEWTLEFDASGRPEARLALLSARSLPLAGFPIGGGELLVAGGKLMQLSFPLSGGVDRFVMPVPSDPALVGLTAYTQATFFGAGLLRGNAYDLRLGY